LPLGFLSHLYYNERSDHVFSGAFVLAIMRSVLVIVTIILLATRVHRAWIAAVVTGAVILVEHRVTTIEWHRTFRSLVPAYVQSILPINFFVNVGADKSTEFARALSVLSALTRIGLAVYLVSASAVRIPYAKAWSCYDSRPMTAWNEGPCPLFTHDWFHSWVCRDNYSPECVAHDIPPSWKQPSRSEMHATAVIVVMYAVHAADMLLLMLDEWHYN